jgi:hypothetical protein
VGRALASVTGDGRFPSGGADLATAVPFGITW